MRLAWTEDAKRDLAEIRDFSLERWGRRATSDYVAQIVSCTKDCLRDPARLRRYGDAYNYSKAGSHFVFVREEPDRNRLAVVRILHQSMDIERHLPDPGEA